MSATRRDVTKSILCLGLAAGVGFPRIGAAEELSGEDLKLRLQAELDAHVRPGCPETRLTVLDCVMKTTATGARQTFRADARVRLDWPPGIRQRGFLFYGPDTESVYEGLRDRVLVEFAAVHPTCITGPGEAA